MELDPVLMYLPIPQRVVSLVLLGLWLWCLFLRIACSHFDVSKVIVTTDTIGLPHYANSKQLYQVNCKTIKQITKLIVPWQLCSISLLQYSVQNNVTNKAVWLVLNVTPLLELLAIVALILKSSTMAARCLKKILWFANIEPKPLRNNYIVMSDTLTSYSKPIMDFTIYLMYLVNDPFNTRCQFEKYQNAVSLNVDLFVGILPSMIRMIQSLREYSRHTTKDDNTQLFNALKYASNIPIMATAVYTRYYKLDSMSIIYWFMLWNSFYTFWWDLTIDWKLGMFNFKAERNISSLRHTLLYRGNYIYFAAIILDFVLRFAWFWEYISGKSIFYGELNIFWLQTLELFRRWVWLFFKVEAEYITIIDDGKIDE